jgi:hypothetical protein
MGNGKIEDLHNIIYVVPERFNNLYTEQMAKEIEELNIKMMKENKKYILIGPGRWGSRDRFIGIPVVWSQISNAKVIVEMELPDFPLDASLGSHFFHNVTAMRVGYFSIKQFSDFDTINWTLINSLTLIEETKYFRHVYSKAPISVLMDGKKQHAIIVQE